MSAISKIYFSPETVEFISNEIFLYPEVETGGAFMGNIKEGTIYVTKVIDGGPNASRSPVDFKCDLHYTDLQIDMHCANTGGEEYYVGEWHTHPQVNPYPSPVDINSFLNIAQSYSKPALLFIVGFLKYSHKKFLDQCIALITSQTDEYIYEIPVEIQKNK